LAPEGVEAIKIQDTGIGISEENRKTISKFSTSPIVPQVEYMALDLDCTSLTSLFNGRRSLL
jgi:hypothetical protein